MKDDKLFWKAYTCINLIIGEKKGQSLEIIQLITTGLNIFIETTDIPINQTWPI